MKNTLVKATLYALRALIYVKRAVVAVFKFIWRVIAPISHFFGGRVIFPVYAFVVRVTKRRIRRKQRYSGIGALHRTRREIFMRIGVVLGVLTLIFAESTVFAGEPVRGNAPIVMYASPNVYGEVAQGEFVAPDEDVGTSGGYGASVAGGRSIIAPFGTLGVTPSSLVAQNSGAQGNVVSYVVESGDTIASIAKHFNIKSETILWENKLSAKSKLAIGDVVRILPVDGVTYKVGRGDTLIAIANKFNVDGAKITASNKLGNDAALFAGETLIIPDAKPLATVVATTKPVKVPVSVITSPVSIPAASASSDSGAQMRWPTSGHVITQYFSAVHTGVDIDGDYDSPIYAAEDGVVVRSGWNSGGYGQHIVIDHGGGVQTLYGHASKIFVQTGDSVTRGQVIAMVGTTGHSTGTHLHFEVRVGGRRLNPLKFVR